MSKLLFRLWCMPARRKLALAEALAGTLAAWVMIRCAPYAMWRSKLGAPVPLSSAPLTGASARSCGERPLEDVAWAHAWLARLFTPHFTCLMLAFSARGMLRRRGLESLLVLGVNRRRERETKQLGAHAWVLSQGYEIVGGETRNEHVPVAAYRDRMSPVGLGKL